MTDVTGRASMARSDRDLCRQYQGRVTDDYAAGRSASWMRWKRSAPVIWSKQESTTSFGAERVAHMKQTFADAGGYMRH